MLFVGSAGSYGSFQERARDARAGPGTPLAATLGQDSHSARSSSEGQSCVEIGVIDYNNDDITGVRRACSSRTARALATPKAP